MLAFSHAMTISHTMVIICFIYFSFIYFYSFSPKTITLSLLSQPKPTRLVKLLVLPFLIHYTCQCILCTVPYWSILLLKWTMKLTHVPFSNTVEHNECTIIPHMSIYMLCPHTSCLYDLTLTILSRKIVI